MRRPFTTAELLARGVTPGAINWARSQQRMTRVYQGVYVWGKEPPTQIEAGLALLVVTDGVASGTLAGVLHGLDSVELNGNVVTVPSRSSSRRPGVRRRDLDTQTVTVDGYPCTSALQALLDLAPVLDDLKWEQALESALRKGLVSLDGFTNIATQHGSKRIRRVLALRPPGAPPTESLLETLMVQLIRTERRLPTPERQVVVRNRHGDFVARVDMAWPDHGIFIELDGQQHKDQPVYDASRQTRVVAATGWLPARFTWDEVTRTPNSTGRRLLELLTVSHALSFAERPESA